MVLHHVPERTGGFVVTSAFLHADCFCRSDLNAGDVVPVPDRFENGVGEPQNHDVLNGFLAEIVVDAEDLVFLATALNHAIESLGTAVIPTEWLFDHHAAALGVFEQAGIGEGSAAAGIELRRDRQIEGAVVAGGPQPVDLMQSMPQLHQIFRLLEIHGLVEHAC